MSIVHGLAIVAAAFLGGAMNSIAGGGTLITFSTLLWIGLDPRIANATSAVALWPGSLGGALGYRKELDDARPWLVRLGIPSLLGGALGSLLLLWTPSATFARLVPYLILFATVLFMLQEPMRRVLPARDVGRATVVAWLGALIFQLAVAVYGGYFGAGIGILMLTLLGLMGLTDIHRANGVKNVLAMCINGVAVAGFIAFRMVSWPEALLMTAAAIAGGYQGAAMAQRLGRTFARGAVIAIGLAISLVLLYQQIR